MYALVLIDFIELNIWQVYLLYWNSNLISVTGNLCYVRVIWLCILTTKFHLDIQDVMTWSNGINLTVCLQYPSTVHLPMMHQLNFIKTKYVFTLLLHNILDVFIAKLCIVVDIIGPQSLNEKIGYHVELNKVIYRSTMGWFVGRAKSCVMRGSSEAAGRLHWRGTRRGVQSRVVGRVDTLPFTTFYRRQLSWVPSNCRRVTATSSPSSLPRSGRPTALDFSPATRSLFTILAISVCSETTLK